MKEPSKPYDEHSASFVHEYFNLSIFQRGGAVKKGSLAKEMQAMKRALPYSVSESIVISLSVEHIKLDLL